MLLICLIIKEHYFERIYTHLFNKQKVESFSYSLNPQFIEQVDYCSIYTQKATIVMLGNSLTYRMFWNELLGRCDVVNRGVGSDITRGLRDRLKFVRPLFPKIVFIEGGVNDLERNIDTTTITNNIKFIIQDIKKHSIIPVLTKLSFVSEKYPNFKNFNKRIDMLNKSYTKLAIQENILTIDLNQTISTDKILKSEFAEPDGIHYTSKAYLIWKIEIQKILNNFKL